MAKKGKNKGTVPTEYAEVKFNHGIFEDYLQYGPQYDTVNDCPVIPGETEFVPRQILGKLTKSMRGLLREYMSHCNPKAEKEERRNQNACSHVVSSRQYQSHH